MRKNQPRFPFKHDGKNFEFLFITGLSGLVLFKLFFSFYFQWEPETKNLDFTAYCLGWLLVPMAGWVFTLFLEKLRKQWVGERPSYYPTMVLTNFVLVLFLFHPRWTAHIGPFAQLSLFLFIEAIGLWASAKSKDSLHSSSRDQGDPYYYWMTGLAVFWVFNIKPDLGGVAFEYSAGYFVLSCVVLIGSFWAFHWGIPERQNPRKVSPPGPVGAAEILNLLLTYGTVLVVLLYLLVDPRFPYDRFHFGFYLGPLSDLIHGKSLLVNINAQYGVFVFYFLRFFFFFLPLGFTSFALVNMILTVFQYFLFFFIARRLFKGWALPLFSLAALLSINHFASARGNPVLYPSTGPLRFGFIYLLGTLVLLRNKYPGWKNIFYLSEAAVVGAATFWSFEVFIYTVPAYLALLLYESVNFGGTSGFDRGSFKKRSVFLIGSVLAVGAFLYRDIYFRTGEWPHWSYYFDYMRTYGDGLGTLPLTGTGYWSLIIGTLYVSLFCVGWISFKSFQKKKTPPANFNVVVLVIFYGMAQFLYFLWRSHPSNLFHICTPTLLLATYWLYYLRHYRPPAVPRVIRSLGFTLAVIFVCVFLQKTVRITVDSLQDQVVPLPELARRIGLALRDQPREDGFAKAAGFLMGKYSKGEKNLVYFFDEKGLEVSMYEGIGKIYPYNDIVQAGLCLPTLFRILFFDPRLKSGDFIYVSGDLQQLVGGCDSNSTRVFELHLWRKLNKIFILRLVDEEYGILVYRVEGPAV